MTKNEALELIKESTGMKMQGMFGSWTGSEGDKMNAQYVKQIKLEPENKTLIATYAVCNYNAMLEELAEAIADE